MRRDRAGWDEVWRGLALGISGRSRCQKRQVGAVFVSADNRDHWLGYNGPPAGLWPPLDPSARDCGSFCPQGSRIALVPTTGFKTDASRRRFVEEPACLSLHAEQNARNAVTDPARLVGGLVVVTAAPCLKCTLTIASTRVDRLVCPPYEQDRAELAIQAGGVLAEAGIETTPWEF